MGRLIEEYEDIKTQQECVSKTIDTLWKMAQKYQQLQADYEARLKENNKLLNDLEELRTMINKFAESYENRLKADLKAILVELQLEIEEYQYEDKYDAVNDDMTGWILAVDVNKIIQQKINELNRENK